MRSSFHKQVPFTDLLVPFIGIFTLGLGLGILWFLQINMGLTGYSEEEPVYLTNLFLQSIYILHQCLQIVFYAIFVWIFKGYIRFEALNLWSFCEAFCLAFLLVMVSGFLGHLLGFSGLQEETYTLINPQSPWFLPLNTVKFLGVGYAEEILFRGLFFYTLQSFNLGVYILSSSIFFALSHTYKLGGSLIVLSLGLILSFHYWHFRRIHSIALAHFMYDSFLLIILYT